MRINSKQLLRFFSLHSLRLCGEFALFLLLALTACTPVATPTPTNAPTTCLGFIVLHDAPHACQAENNRALISTSGEQITLEAFGASIVVNGQIELVYEEEKISIQLLLGSAVVGAKGRTRVLTLASPIEIPLVNGIAQAPIEANLSIMSQSNIVPEASAESLLILEATATFEGDCTLREDWGRTYTVQAGDVLEEIAEAYGLTIAEIAQANCITDPSRLRIGQVLRIAGDTPTATPSAIAFRADTYSLTKGQCTTLRWDVFNVAEVYLDEVSRELNSFLEVCPEESTTYNLRVIFLDGSETERELLISVEEN